MAKLDGAVCLRLHQRECLLNIMHALREPTTMRDGCCKPSKFLIQHAPGSGKTLTMAALTYALINEDGDDDDGGGDGSSSSNNNNNYEDFKQCSSVKTKSDSMSVAGSKTCKSC